jgi:hypothetical protein
MEEVRDRAFGAGEEIVIDGVTFVNCTFAGARLRYTGGPHPRFLNTSVNDSAWIFEDSALRTIQVLQALADGEGRPMVEDLFRPGSYLGS